MSATEMLPQGFSCWTNIRAQRALKPTGTDMLGLYVGPHVGTFLGIEGTLQAIPSTRAVFLHVTSN